MPQLPSRQELHEALASRQGEELQAKLEAAAVAVCGLGGLGSNIAIALARAGVGKLLLIDFDRVDITNLNRQQYRIDQIGLLKAKALRDNLATIAPYCNVTIDTARLTPENIPGKLAGWPIICEAFDQAEAKAMLLDTVTENFPDAWLVSGVGMAGLASANLIRTRRLGRRLVLCGDGTSGTENGTALLGARVLVCAAHEATAVIRIIAGNFAEN